jgi:predicted enzyme related to lactoylglutathione lyase
VPYATVVSFASHASPDIKSHEYGMANAIAHFEIYGDNPAKLADFYGGLLGWQLKTAPGVDYWRIDTGAQDGQVLEGGVTYCPATAASRS